MSYNLLTNEEKRVIEDKGTEPPFSGEYDDFYEEGTFICRKCNAPLFSSKSKFDARCGWPSFDENFPNAVKRVPDGRRPMRVFSEPIGSLNRKSDPEGIRTEIQCANCMAHLGHVFEGEGMTEKDTRHCVNSLSIRFVPKGKIIPKMIS